MRGAGLGDRELQGGEAAVYEDTGRGWRAERMGCSVLLPRCQGGNKPGEDRNMRRDGAEGAAFSPSQTKPSSCGS